jgi:hypothetical protein
MINYKQNIIANKPQINFVVAESLGHEKLDEKVNLVCQAAQAVKSKNLFLVYTDNWLEEFETE